MEIKSDLKQTTVIKQQSQQNPRQKPRRLEDPPESDYRILRLFYGFLHTWLTILAKTRPGNFGYRWADYFLFKIQRSVEWCIPKKDPQTGESVQSDVERPMPWIIFIPALVNLRFLRTYLSFISIILNGKQYTRENLLQNTMSLRRYLRGLKSLAIKQGSDHAKVEQERKAARYFWRAYYSIRDLVLVRKTAVGQCSNNNKKALNNSINIKTEAPQNNQNKRANSELADESGYGQIEDLTFKQLLDKYELVEQNSTEDPDYNPSDSPSSDTEEEISDLEYGAVEEEVIGLLEDLSKPVFDKHLNGNVESYPGHPTNGDSKPNVPRNSENSANQYEHTNGGDDFTEKQNCSPIDKENMPANHDGDQQQLTEVQSKPKQDVEPKTATKSFKKPDAKQNSNIPQPNSKHRPQFKYHTKSAKQANRKNSASQNPSDSHPKNTKKSSPF